ncbi:MAG TPA: ATP synthase A1 subunit C [Methanoculleus sp.]|nr:ATP synthase A1 subunit C [Methanoculleus sp.]
MTSISVAGSAIGPAPYIYVTTRMRVRKSKLLPREEYLRMLNMSLPEITRIIEESQYKAEIDELSQSFSGIDLVEVALSWNLAKEYQKILAITPGRLRMFLQTYLRSWDIQNVLTILRGKSQGMRVGKIKEILIPAGSLDRITLDRLLAEESPERVLEALKGRRLYPVIEKEFPAAQESGSYAHMENELYKAYYADLIETAQAGVKGGRAFLEYIRLEIDIRNLQAAFRLRQGPIPEDAWEMFIEGGEVKPGELVRLAAAEAPDELIETLQQRIGAETLGGLIDQIRGDAPIHEIENALTHLRLDKMTRISKRHVHSIVTILDYLERKRFEVINLRALARGKESNLPTERIQSYLVI